MKLRQAKPTCAVPIDGYAVFAGDCGSPGIFKGETTMTMRLITESEIAQRQHEVRVGAHRARNSFTIAGIRQLVGNTFIALGTRLHGAADTARNVEPRPATIPAHGV